jgi:hypothetical protein
VGIKNVDVIDAQALQRIIAALHDVFPPAPVAVRTGPHAVARLAADDQLISRHFLQDRAEDLLTRAGGFAVVVGQIEMGDPAIERGEKQRLGGLVVAIAADRLPTPQADHRQRKTRPAAGAVLHRFIARFFEGHFFSSSSKSAAQTADSPPLRMRSNCSRVNRIGSTG